MPLYRIVEKRCYEETYLVRADDEDGARYSTDVVVEEGQTDSWADDIVSIKLVEEED